MRIDSLGGHAQVPWKYLGFSLNFELRHARVLDFLGCPATPANSWEFHGKQAFELYDFDSVHAKCPGSFLPNKFGKCQSLSYSCHNLQQKTALVAQSPTSMSRQYGHM